MLGSRKTGTAFAAGAAALLLAACGSEQQASGGSGQDTVTVQLDYQVRGNHGMFFVAKEKGYFEEQGIHVEEIRTGTGSPDALRTIGTGKADFGFADLPSLVTARSQNVPVQALAAVNQVSPLGMCSLSDNVRLNTVQDLEGLTVGVHPAGSTYIFYEALLAANDVDRSTIKEVTVTPPYENYLLQNRVDAVICYIDAEVPLLEDAAGGKGSVSKLLGSDAGYDAYGSGLVTSDEMIEQDSDLVQRFTDAYMKAFEYVVDHPEETAAILAESSPEQAGNAELFERQLKADIKHTFTSDTTDKRGLGAMSKQQWRSTIDILASQGVLEGDPPSVEDVHDSTFVRSYWNNKN